MKNTEQSYKLNILLIFICAIFTIGLIAYWNYSSEKELKKEVQEQQRNDYSDALIKNCEPYNK